MKLNTTSEFKNQTNKYCDVNKYIDKGVKDDNNDVMKMYFL